jgi:intracellular septation protein
MSYWLKGGKLLLVDMASTVLFLVLYWASNNLLLAVGCSIAFGIAQIGWEIMRRRPIDTMQWVSLIVVLASGSGALATNDARFVMIKPSLIYIGVGAAMLKRGWQNRYQPAIALEMVPDVLVVFGFVWAGLMFFSAAFNIVVALNFDVVQWASITAAFGIVSKVALFWVQFGIMWAIGKRRYRAQMAQA